MAIPDFQTIMLPFMLHIADGQEHTTTETHDTLAKVFNLTDEEANQYLPSGNQKTFYNRVFWAKAHLKMAGLIENIKRGHFRISQTGKDALGKKPKEINLRYLKQFPVYLENIGRTKDSEKIIDNAVDIELKETPEEVIANSYLKIRKNLALELLSKVKVCTPAFFENLVVELLVKMGYGGTIKEAGKATRLTSDGGIDGIIKEDRLGLDFIYIQAKRWDSQSVGRPDIQSFVGALDGQRATKGVFITTSKFSETAIEYVKTITKKVILIDGEQLTNYMIDYGLGVSTFTTFDLKRVDHDYFGEE
ncbi:restriction endonuclease [Flavihumibacter stibioxidans]|uniref:Restriction endonuclease n=1 Tax=Flavihumibacter stibioxidans TaxID=1834163 RepID=A0ABR7MAG7_9BACT|nr:restriction endonuclease [Flavihumibacter stibioxidans]MBC6491558.1 restriction endonuclease [Flavihumibacter stibioxidans]